MTTTTGCRRKQRRRPTSGSGSAWIEVNYPQPEGRRHELALVDVSVSGLSFIFEEQLAGLETGADLSDVLIHLGDCEIRGELVVMHVTPQGPGRWLCGALFYAAGDTDLLKWRAAIAGMEAAAG
jgi:hypothetical protein